MSERYAFRMQLLPGKALEYQKRHDEIWPELLKLLMDAGISDYSIHLDPETGVLFGMLTRSDDHRMDSLTDDPLLQEWWEYMSDIMDTHPSNEPILVPLQPMFYMR